MAEKLKRFVKQNSFLIILTAVVLFSFVSIANKTVYTAVLYVSALFVACFYGVTESVTIWLVCLFFEQTNSVYALPLLALMFAIAVLKDAIKIKFKFKKEIIFPIIMTLALIAMCFLVAFNKKYYKEVLSFVAILIIALEFFYLRGRFDFEKITKIGSVLLLVSCAFSFVMYFAGGFTLFHSDSSNLKRFMGLTTHENMIATYSIMFMAFDVLLFFKKKLKLVYFIIFELLLAVAGVATMSKAFIVLFAILVILYFIKSFMVNKKASLIQLGCFAIFVAIVAVIFRNKVVSLFNRFFIYFGYRENILDTLTTGRWAIWKRFYWRWCTTLKSIFFGLGVSYKPYEYIHNFYLELVFKFGIVGFMAIVSLVIYFFSISGKNKKLRFENLIPFVIVLANMFIEVFIAKRIIVFFIAVVGIFYLSEDKQKVGESAQTETNQTEDLTQTETKQAEVEK